MKRILPLIALLIATLFSAKDAKATHTAGGELIYELVPGTTNTYLFTFKFYRACAYQNNPGGPWFNSSTEPASFQMCYFNSCTNSPTSINLTKVVGTINNNPPLAPVPNGSVMGNGCDSIVTTCTTLTATIPGFEEWWYQGTVTLPTTCNMWTFFVQLCCRNNGIVNVTTPGSQNIYAEVTFDNTVNNINNSPKFTYNGSPSAIPIPYVCINSPYVHNGSGMDPDGDSLVYETIAPRHKAACNTTAPVSILIIPAFNILNAAGNPLSCNNTYSINQTNGVFGFTPNALGQYVISQKISEYRNGALIGSVMRDMQIVVDNCVPLVANPILDSTSVINGIVQNDTVRACPNDSLTFCFDIYGLNGTYLLQLYDNHVADFPGSSISYSNPQDSILRVCMTWMPLPGDSGVNILSITVKDSFNCQTTPSTVQMPVWVNKPLKSSNDTSICVGDNVQFATLGNGLYQWSVLPGGSGVNTLSCLNCPDPVATPTTTTTYVVTDPVCNFKDSITVTVATGPNLTITPNSTTCVNSTLQLDVTVNNPAGQTFSYTWSPSIYLNNPNISNPVMTNPTAPTNYTVTVVPQGVLACQSTASVQVDVLLGYDIATGDTTICDGDAVQVSYTGGNPKYTYAWTPTTFVSDPNIIDPVINPTPFGVYNYSFTASYPGCPDSTQDLTITVEPLPIVDAGSDREICLGDSVHLHGSVMPVGGVYTYEWLPGADLNNNTILDPIFTGVTTTVFTLSATTPKGCKGEANMAVNVIPVDFLVLDGERSLCPNDTAHLHVAGGVSYLWSPSRYVDDSTAMNVVVNPITTTEFVVTGYDAKGCKDTVKTTVVVNPEAVIDAGDTQVIYPGESVELHADGNCSMNFVWFPPNGLSADNIKNPIAQPSVTTRYTVSAQTEQGCKAVDTVEVVVSPESVVELPNAFSPGSGTSINDELRIIVKGLAKLNFFRVYNRWGQEVFSTSDITKGWNGQYNGKPQPMGVYVYVLDGVTQSGKRFTKQGNVTLVR